MSPRGRKSGTVERHSDNEQTVHDTEKIIEGGAVYVQCPPYMYQRHGAVPGGDGRGGGGHPRVRPVGGPLVPPACSVHHHLGGWRPAAAVESLQGHRAQGFHLPDREQRLNIGQRLLPRGHEQPVRGPGGAAAVQGGEDSPECVQLRLLPLPRQWAERREVQVQTSEL